MWYKADPHLVWKIGRKLELDSEVPNSPQWSQSLEAKVIQKFVILTNNSVAWSHWSWNCTLELQFPLTLKSATKLRYSSGRKKQYTANFTPSGTDKCHIQLLNRKSFVHTFCMQTAQVLDFNLFFFFNYLAFKSLKPMKRYILDNLEDKHMIEWI